MSIRTIIEINHDYIQRIDSRGIAMADLLMALMTDDADAWEYFEQHGIRKITQRHHSSSGVIQFEHHSVKLP